MKPIEDFKNKIIEGDCMEIMKEMPDNSIDTIITDPPYGLEFMGKEWDRLGNVGEGRSKRPKPAISGQEFKDRIGRVSYNATQNVRCRKCGHWKFSGTPCKCEEPDFPNIKAIQAKEMEKWHYIWAKEALRVAKPGTILMAFGGTRTYHRLACAIEDAGWEIFDCIFWIYASGFPKSLNIGQAIDKDACKKQLTEKLGRKPTKEEFKKEWEGFRRVVGKGKSDKTAIWQECGGMGNFNLTKPTTPEAKQWEGYGTALKPAVEPIVVARKPIEGTYAENALKWGVSGLNIEEARIPYTDGTTPQQIMKKYTGSNVGKNNPTNAFGVKDIKCTSPDSTLKGRFPANIILDEEAAQELDRQSGNKCGQLAPTTGNEPSTLKRGNVYGDYSGYGKESQPKDKLGGASRFFKVIDDYPRFMYCPKASRAERNMGCEGLEEKKYQMTHPQQVGTLEDRYNVTNHNNHPTVKPLKLMEYLCILTKTPPQEYYYLKKGVSDDIIKEVEKYL